jgi:hypothetical protein
MRGRSPDRSGDFKVGHKKRGGRQKGTRNHYSADLKRSLLEAASRIGSDGKGKDGLRGYLIWVAMYYPEAYLREILQNVIPWECVWQEHAEPPVTAAELDQWVRQYVGKRNIGKRTAGADPTMSTDAASRPAAAAAAQTGRTDLVDVLEHTDVGLLMHIAVAAPPSFCKGLAAAGLPRPNNRRMTTWTT